MRDLDIKIPEGVSVYDIHLQSPDSALVIVQQLRSKGITFAEIDRKARIITLFPYGINTPDMHPIISHFLRQFYYELYDHTELGMILGSIDTGHCIVIKDDVSFKY